MKTDTPKVDHMAISESKVRFPSLAEFDPDIYEAIQNEKHREMSTLELIASENFVSKAVMEAQGSVLTNKYAEGLPGKRYYGGCKYVDVVESLAIERANSSSAPTTLTYSLTAVRKQIPLYIWLPLSPGIQCSVWTLLMVATLRMGTQLTYQACTSLFSVMESRERLDTLTMTK